MFSFLSLAFQEQRRRKIDSSKIAQREPNTSGKIKVGKLNTDENPDVASKYKIMGIPTIIFFKNGEKADQIVGAVPKPQLKAKIDALLG